MCICVCVCQSEVSRPPDPCWIIDVQSGRERILIMAGWQDRESKWMYLKSMEPFWLWRRSCERERESVAWKGEKRGSSSIWGLQKEEKQREIKEKGEKQRNILAEHNAEWDGVKRDIHEILDICLLGNINTNTSWNRKWVLSASYFSVFLSLLLHFSPSSTGSMHGS